LPAAEPGSVGIVPFDVTAVDGAGAAEAGRVLATLVRVEMLKNRQLRPQLVTLPADARPPLGPKQAAAIGQAADVEFVLLGTVLEATTTRSTNRAASALGGIVGSTSIGGSVSRTTGKVTLHAELVNAATGTFDAFEVDASNTDVGIGADLWTTLGSFNTGDDGWQKTPFGKALREAAGKLTTEVARRAKK
jgi:hypothetical protein